MGWRAGRQRQGVWRVGGKYKRKKIRGRQTSVKSAKKMTGLVRTWRNQNLIHCRWERKMVKLQLLRMSNTEIPPPREMKTCPHQNLFMNVHSSITHDRLKVETTQMSVS